MTGDRPALRVMHLVLSLSPGGTERLVVDLARRLHPDVPCAVCCLDDEGELAAELRPAGIEVFALHRRPGFHPLLGLQVAREAARRRISVLHCHQYSPFVYGTIAGFARPGVRLVFTEHGRLSDAPPSRKRRAANRLLGWRPDVITAVSAELRSFMAAEGLPAGRIEVVHNGIEPGSVGSVEHRQRVRRELGVPDDAFVVGTMARLDPVKRLDVLLRAMRTVAAAEHRARLVVVGDGPEAPSLARLAAELGLGTATTFCGQRRDARSLLAGFDVFVNSSASEGISLTILEAMAASRPVVATRVGGTPDVVLDDVTGILVPAGDPDAVADAILRLLRNPAWAAACGASGRQRVVDRFTFDRMVRAYLALYTGSGEAR